MNTDEPACRTPAFRPRISLALLAVFALAFLLRMEGIHWPRLHPDEPTIARFLDNVITHGNIENRVYPAGMFALCRPVWSVTQSVNSGMHRWRHWMGSEKERTAPTPNRVVFVRLFNVWLGSATCLVVFLLARRVSGSGPAGILAALFMAFSPQHIEHSHYAESDVAMVFMLTLTLWLWARLPRQATGTAFLAAALATGFTAGTKFTLFALAPLIPLHAFVAAPPSATRSRAANTAFWCAAALLAAAAGFALANPGIFSLPEWIAGLRQGSSSVYAETRQIMGPDYGNPWASFLKHARLLVQETRAAGLGWFGLALAGGLFAWRKPYRSAFLGSAAFTLIFLFYYFGVAPWVRPQEVMTFQPAMAAAAAVGATALVRLAGANGLSLRIIPAVIVVLMALLPTALHGLRRTSLFQWTEPRIAAQEWLQRTAPRDRVLGCELYTYPASVDSMREARGVVKIERAGPEGIAAMGCDYVLRNLHAKGRGVNDPRTGLPYLPYLDNYTRFAAQSQLLKVWAPLYDESAFGIFCGSDIRLFGTRPPATGPDLGMALAQPLLISPSGRETATLVGANLGAIAGIEVNRYPREIALGGPWSEDTQAYLVVNTLERGAEIRVSQPGSDIRERMDPYDVRVFPVQPRSRFWRTDEHHRIILSTTPVRHILYVPCYARIVSGPRQLLAVLAALNRLDLASGLPEFDEGDGQAAAYVASVHAGRWHTADRLRPSAESRLTAIAEYLEGKRDDLAIGGISAFYHQEFARCRILFFEPASRQALAKMPDNAGYGARLPLPLRLPGGSWHVDVDLSAPGDMRPRDPVRIEDEQGREMAAIKPEAFDGRMLHLSLPYQGGRERAPEFRFVSQSGGVIMIHRVELRWDIRDRLEESAALLRSAIARHDESRTRQAAPRAARIEFGHLVAITAFQPAADGRGARITVQSLAPDLPPLGVAACLKRGSKWDRVAFQPLNHNQSIAPGASVEVEVSWPDPRLDFTTDAERMAVAIESDVEWYPGRLPVQGTGAHHVTVSELNTRARRGNRAAQ